MQSVEEHPRHNRRHHLVHQVGQHPRAEHRGNQVLPTEHERHGHIVNRVKPRDPAKCKERNETPEQPVPKPQHKPKEHVRSRSPRKASPTIGVGEHYGEVMAEDKRNKGPVQQMKPDVGERCRDHPGDRPKPESERDGEQRIQIERQIVPCSEYRDKEVHGRTEHGCREHPNDALRTQHDYKVTYNCVDRNTGGNAVGTQRISGVWWPRTLDGVQSIPNGRPYG